MSLTLKITSLFVRTAAKPMANAIKRNAHEHERFRHLCVTFAQGLHRIDMRMRLGLLQDPAVIDRQIQKEVQAAEAARKKAAIPTVKTEAETKAEESKTEKEREAIKQKAEARRKPRIRPLSESRAIELGANFVSETFIFAVAVGLIVFEQWRQRRKTKNARDDIREDLEETREELKAVREELAETRAELEAVKAMPTARKLLGFWKGKDNVPSEEDYSMAENKNTTVKSISSESTPAPNEQQQSKTKTPEN